MNAVRIVVDGMAVAFAVSCIGVVTVVALFVIDKTRRMLTEDRIVRREMHDVDTDSWMWDV